jgi:hypothetical protein
MIKVNKYDVQTVEHFDNNGNSLGFLNEQENVDLRCQIAEEKVSGYYLVFENIKIPIDTNGKINDWKIGLYDITGNLHTRLFKSQYIAHKGRVNSNF